MPWKAYSDTWETDMNSWIWAVVLVGSTGAGLVLLGAGAVYVLCKWLDKNDLVITKAHRED